MKNIHALAKDLLERLPKLNFLVHSAGVFGIYGLQETEEGIDKLALGIDALSAPAAPQSQA